MTSLESQFSKSFGRHFRTSPDVRLGRPLDSQIGSLGDVLVKLEGDILETSWGPIFGGGYVQILCVLLLLNFFHVVSDYFFIIKQNVSVFF